VRPRSGALATRELGFRLFLAADALFLGSVLFLLLHAENRPQVRASLGAGFALSLALPSLAAALLLPRARLLPLLLQGAALVGAGLLWGRAEIARGPWMYGPGVSVLGLALLAHHLGGFLAAAARALRPAPAPLLRLYLFALAGATAASHALVFLP